MADNESVGGVPAHHIALRAEAQQIIEQGTAALLAGDQQSADELLAAAIRRYQQIGDQYAIAAHTGNYGWALRRAGRRAEAGDYLARAAELFAALGLADFAERHQSAAAESMLLDADFLAGLPPMLRRALEQGDAIDLQLALDALPLAERQLMLERLAEAGIIRIADDEVPDDEEVLRQFEPLLQGIAAAARGDAGERREVEAALPQLEQRGWQISAVVYAIWQGERSAERLTAGLDAADASLVRRVLTILSEQVR
jgi:hypothetical protein